MDATEIKVKVCQALSTGPAGSAEIAKAIGAEIKDVSKALFTMRTWRWVTCSGVREKTSGGRKSGFVYTLVRPVPKRADVEAAITRRRSKGARRSARLRGHIGKTVARVPVRRDPAKLSTHVVATPRPVKNDVLWLRVDGVVTVSFAATADISKVIAAIVDAVRS